MLNQDIQIFYTVLPVSVARHKAAVPTDHMANAVINGNNQLQDWHGFGRLLGTIAGGCGIPCQQHTVRPVGMTLSVLRSTLHLQRIDIAGFRGLRVTPRLMPVLQGQG